MFGEDDEVVSHIQRGDRFVVDNALESAGQILSADIRDEPVDDALGVLGEEACFVPDGGVVRMELVHRPRLEGGGCRWSCCGTNPEVSPMCGMGVGSVGLRQPLRMWVGGGAACLEGCCVCGIPRTGMGVESPAGMREMGQLMLIGIPRWCDVGDVHGHGALAKRAVVARAPVDEAWLGCPAMSVSSRGVDGSKLSDVGVS